jgi:hypothetical protein
MKALTWPRYPAVFEINSWVWLSELSQKLNRLVDFSSVPAAEWDAIANSGFDAVWLMGVWERSPAGKAIANKNHGLLESFRRALPDFGPADNVGSPYCVRRYVVDKRLGGTSGLAVARNDLAKRGLRLILDFVPNHVAPDHPWLTEHPEYFIKGTDSDIGGDPTSWFRTELGVFACGRDPYFPAWPDVLQLNAFHPGLRQAATETLLSIGEQSDGARCDMAMLMMNPVFERTWAHRAGNRPETEYWINIISAVKRANPNFLFVAEAYWDLEWELQQQGFDFCYDKRLYDRLEHDNAESVRLHLCADSAYQEKLVRFIENHDEPRAAATFSPEKHRAAAITTSTLPGMKLFHQGQFNGRKVRLPVFLGRAPEEPNDQGISNFYEKLLRTVNSDVFRGGQWSLCEREGWPDNPSYQNIVAWNWVKNETRYLIVVNLSDRTSQAQVRVPWPEIGGESLHVLDMLSDAWYERAGDEMRGPGLYVELGPWSYHLFRVSRTDQSIAASAN